MRIAHQDRYSRDTGVTRQIFTPSDAGAGQVVHQLIPRFDEAMARSREKSFAVRRLIVNRYVRARESFSRERAVRSLYSGGRGGGGEGDGPVAKHTRLLSFYPPRVVSLETSLAKRSDAIAVSML